MARTRRKCKGGKTRTFKSKAAFKRYEMGKHAAMGRKKNK